MKVSTIIASVFATLAAAAPTTSPVEKRLDLDLGAYNQFSFANDDLQYLNAVNQLDLNAFAKLSTFNNLEIVQFQQVFVQQDVFDINALLQLQQIQLLGQLAGLGIFSNFDLASVQINILDLGLLSDSIGGFDISSLIDQAIVPQIKTKIETTGESRSLSQPNVTFEQRN